MPDYNTTLKLGFVSAIFLLASCSSNLPDIPKYEFCRFEIAGQPFCESFYKVDKEFCDENGETVTECGSVDLPDTPEYEFCRFAMGGQIFCRNLSLEEVSKEFCDDYGVIVDTCEGEQ